MKKRRTKEKRMRTNGNVSMNERAVLNVAETADFLRVSESSIWKLIRQGKITPTRIGDRVLFARTYLARYAEGR
jgi:excisionase family DNA binding protein